jgi:hypothetical protein
LAGGVGGLDARLDAQLGVHGGEVVPASIRSWVTLEDQDFYGRSLEEGLAWCLVWVMAKGTGHPKGLDWGHEIGVGPFRFDERRDRGSHCFRIERNSRVPSASHTSPSFPPRRRFSNVS